MANLLILIPNYVPFKFKPIIKIKCIPIIQFADRIIHQI